MQVIDRTEQTASTLTTRNGRNIYSRGDSMARRRVGSINAIMLHQTAFESSHVERYDAVIANYVVLQSGLVVKVRNHEDKLNSIGTNQHAIDIEFVGNYPNERLIRRAQRRGIELPAPPRAQIQAGRALIAHLKNHSGLGITHLLTHAQFTAKNCCGPQLWANLSELQNLSFARGNQSVVRNWMNLFPSFLGSR